VVGRSSFLIFLAIFAWSPGCGRDTPEGDRRSAPAPPAAAAAASPIDKTAGSSAPRIIFLGDSLTAGLGLELEQSFPALIQKRIDAGSYQYEILNAGVSGDTSAGGLRRLEWALGEGKTAVLVVALGGNDGLRGLPTEQLESNLAQIIEQGQKRGLTVILAGMEAPPNFGAEYTARFRAVYPRLAERYQVQLIPFLLDGVAGNAALNQADGIHPNARGAERVADLVWKVLEPELADTRRTTTR
jgi:acyl-CoA thioesterase-1